MDVIAVNVNIVHFEIKRVNEQEWNSYKRKISITLLAWKHDNGVCILLHNSIHPGELKCKIFNYASRPMLKNCINIKITMKYKIIPQSSYEYLDIRFSSGLFPTSRSRINSMWRPSCWPPMYWLPSFSVHLRIAARYSGEGLRSATYVQPIRTCIMNAVLLQLTVNIVKSPDIFEPLWLNFFQNYKQGILFKLGMFFCLDNYTFCQCLCTKHLKLHYTVYLPFSFKQGSKLQHLHPTICEYIIFWIIRDQKLILLL